MGGPKIGIAVASKNIFEAEIGWKPATLVFRRRDFVVFGPRPD